MSEAINQWLCLVGLGIAVSALVIVWAALGRKGGHRR